MSDLTHDGSACQICGAVKHHCQVCREICAGCIADKEKPQDCKLCANRGYIGDLYTGPVVACAECPKGMRFKLWVAHEKREGNYIPDCLKECA